MAHSSGVTIHLPHPPNGAGVPPATDEKSDPCEDDGLMGPIEPNDARFEAQLKVLLALPHQQWALISGASSDPWHFSHIRYLACLPDEVYVRPLSHHTSVTTISHHTISYHTISDHHQSAVSYSAAMTLTLPMTLTLLPMTLTLVPPSLYGLNYLVWPIWLHPSISLLPLLLSVALTML